MEKRFNALRIIATIYKVIGGIIAVLGVLAFLAICAGGVLGGRSSFNSPFGGAGVFGAIFSGVLILIIGALYALILYGVGEGIYLLLALEENTRQTAQTVQNLHLSSGSALTAPLPSPPPTRLPSSPPPTGLRDATAGPPDSLQ